MSEHSDSWHLHSKSAEEAVSLLRRAEVDGFVFPPHGGWVAFVSADDEDAVARIVAANTTLVVRYEHAADHGSAISLFDGPRRKGHMSWRTEVSKKVRGGLAPFVTAGLISRAACERLRGGCENARDVASALGLSKLDWLSYRYELSAEHAAPGRIIVDGRSGDVQRGVDARARDQMMCALSSRHRALIEAGDASLVTDLHDAIDEVDHGVELWLRWHVLGLVLDAEGTCAAAAAAVRGELGTRVAAPADARILSPREVATVAKQLAALRGPLSAPGLAEVSPQKRSEIERDLAAVKELFAEAAVKRCAVLVSFLPAHGVFYPR